jgi:sugar/nucleoside kinase (ribokinase family)
MSKPILGVVAIGNALVDVLSQTSDEFVAENSGAEKGSMALIDETQAVELYSKMKNCVVSSGGSAANTMAGFASFGGKGGFIAKTADDELGQIFRHDLQSLGIKYTTQPLITGPETGRCLVLISPDAQRTMNTFLGASVELSPDDVDEELIGNAQVTYLEGYLFDKPLAKQAFIKAAESAHRSGHKIALTLSDPFCVDRHRDDFLKLIENHVDILFANEEELKSLFMQRDFDEAVNAISKHVELAVITRGEKGAIIRCRENHEEDYYTIPAVPVDEVIDTTGAGDQFAAGFLYGLCEGYDWIECGRLGAIAAAEVISHIGPRPATSLADLAKKAA